MQLVARYTGLTIDDDVFAAGLASSGASREARSFTIAANWFPTAYIKYYATFERTAFDSEPPRPRPTENVFLVRAQLAF